jgi:hypothetical protein
MHREIKYGRFLSSTFSKVGDIIRMIYRILKNVCIIAGIKSSYNYKTTYCKIFSIGHKLSTAIRHAHINFCKSIIAFGRFYCYLLFISLPGRGQHSEPIVP